MFTYPEFFGEPSTIIDDTLDRFQHIYLLLVNLSAYFFGNTKIEINQKLQTHKNNYDNGVNNEKAIIEILDSDHEQDYDYCRSIEGIDNICKNDRCLNLICSLLRKTRYNCTRISVSGLYNSWKFLEKHISVEQLVLFLDSTINLMIYSSQKLRRKLSINSANLYILLLSTNDSIPCKYFDEDLILKCMQTFNMLSTVRLSKEIRNIVDVQNDILNFLQDLTHVIEHLHLQNNQKIVEGIVDAMIKLIRDNWIYGYDSINALKITQKAYDVLEKICWLDANMDILDTHHHYSMETVEKIYYPIKTVFLKVTELLDMDIEQKVHDGVDVCEDDESHLGTNFFRKIIQEIPNAGEFAFKSIIKEWIATPITEDLEKETFLINYMDVDDYIYTKTKKTILTYIEFVLKSSHDESKRLRSLDVLYWYAVLCLPKSLATNDITRQRIILLGSLQCLTDSSTKIMTLATEVTYQIFASESCVLRNLITTIFGNTSEMLLYPSGRDLNGEPSKKKICLNVTSDIRELIDMYATILPFHLRNAFDKIDGHQIFIMKIFSLVMIRSRSLFECERFESFFNKITDSNDKPLKEYSIGFIVKAINKYPTFIPVLRIFIENLLIYAEDDQVYIYALKVLQMILFDNIKMYAATLSLYDKRTWILIKMLYNITDRELINNKLLIISRTVKNRDDVIMRITSHLETENNVEATELLTLL